MADGSSLFLHAPALTGPRNVGVITNPASFSKGLDPREAEGWPEIRFAAPRSQSALLRTLRGFARDGVDLLVVAGGDGTLRDVLSALPLAYGDHAPELALIPTGNTNLAARALGLGGNRQGALGKLLAAVQAEARGEARLHRVAAPLLEIAWRGADARPPLRGFFIGSGAFAAGKRLADSVVHGRGIHNGPAVAVTVVASILRSVFGFDRAAPSERCDMSVDGAPVLRGRQFAFLATALPRLMFGLWPFRAEGSGELHFLSIAAPSRRLWATLPTLLLSPVLRGARRLLRNNGVASGRAHRIRLALEGSFVFDGEFFDAGPNGVTVSTTAPVTFVHA